MQIVYGESWDDICDSCHSRAPGLALCRYRRVSWHWFQGLRHDSYLDINFFIITFHECRKILKRWYLGNYLAWDLETNASLRAGIDLMHANSGVSEWHESQISFHLSPYQICSTAQQITLFSMSEPRCNGINGSSDIDLPWFESRTRSILTILMLKSPN